MQLPRYVQLWPLSFTVIEKGRVAATSAELDNLQLGSMPDSEACLDAHILGWLNVLSFARLVRRKPG